MATKDTDLQDFISLIAPQVATILQGQGVPLTDLDPEYSILEKAMQEGIQARDAGAILRAAAQAGKAKVARIMGAPAPATPAIDLLEKADEEKHPELAPTVSQATPGSALDLLAQAHKKS